MAVYATSPAGFRGYSPYKLPAACQAAAGTMKTWTTKQGHVLEQRSVIFNGTKLTWIRMQRKSTDQNFQCQVKSTNKAITPLTFCCGSGSGSNCTNILTTSEPVSDGFTLQWGDSKGSGSATGANGIISRACGAYNFIGPFSIQVA